MKRTKNKRRHFIRRGLKRFITKKRKIQRKIYNKLNPYIKRLDSKISSNVVRLKPLQQKGAGNSIQY